MIWLLICLYEVLQVSYHTVCSHLCILAVHHFDSTMLTVAANESDGAAIVTVRRRRYLQRESTVIIQPVTGTAEGNRILMVQTVAVKRDMFFWGGRLFDQASQDFVIFLDQELLGGGVQPFNPPASPALSVGTCPPIGDVG